MNNCKCDKAQFCSGRSYVHMASQYEKLEPIDILIIREMGTGAEYKTGQISGKDVQILQQMFDKYEITKHYTIDFVCALGCYIPKKKGANPYSKDVLDNCHKKLFRYIHLRNPKYVIICGKIPMQIVTGDASIKIKSEYAIMRTYPKYGDIKFFPILNPGILIHAPAEFKNLQHYFSILKDNLFIGEDLALHDTGRTEYTVLDTPEKCYLAWGHLNKLNKEGQKWFSYDIETTGLDYRNVDFLVMGIGYATNKAYVIPRELMHLCHNFLEGINWKCIWQNGKYDKKIMWARKLGCVSIDHDTMYMHYVLDETSEHNLEYLARMYLRAKPYKYKMNQNWKVVSKETYKSFFDALCERVAVDCDYTLQLAEILHKKLEEQNSIEVYEKLCIRPANFLSRVEQNGCLTDRRYLQTIDKFMDEKIMWALKELQEEANRVGWNKKLYLQETNSKSGSEEFNPSSYKQVKWLLFDVLGLVPRIKNKKSPTDKKVLESIENAPQLVKNILQYRKYKVEQSTFIRGLLNAQDEEGIVRTNFNLHVTATGRLSSKEPNIQNQSGANAVTNVRRAFIAPKGYVIAEIDYSGAELRWLAYLSQCPILKEVFNTGINLHHKTATELYGANYTKIQKLRAKAANFGIAYGREAKSFQDEFDMTSIEAKELVNGWLNTYYGARDYLNWCAQQVKEGKYLETPFGRRRRFGLVSSGSLHNLMNEAKNFPIQSSSSDLLLTCAMDLEDKLKHFDTKIINLVHDSILMYIPAKAEIISAVGRLCNQVMVNKPIELFKCNIPFKTDFEIGLDWGNTVFWDYESSCVTDEDHTYEKTLEEYLWDRLIEFEKERHNV